MHGHVMLHVHRTLVVKQESRKKITFRVKVEFSSKVTTEKNGFEYSLMHRHVEWNDEWKDDLGLLLTAQGFAENGSLYKLLDELLLEDLLAFGFMSHGRDHEKDTERDHEDLGVQLIHS